MTGTVSSEDYRAWIKASGLRLFAERGVQAVSVAEICRAAEVANGTFYNFYRNKSELVAEFLTDAYEGLAAELRAVEEDPAGAEALHRRDVGIIVDFTARNRDLIRIALRDEGARRLTAGNVAELFVAQRTAGLRRGMRSGFYEPGVEPEMIARAENGLMTEILGWWLEDEARMGREELIEQLVAIRLRITNGVVPRREER